MKPGLTVKEKKITDIFSASTLKIFACIFMLIDHIGVELYPSVEVLRIIGRLAYPIFAFFIAEGCKYTSNRLKRFLTVFIIGVGCEMVYIIYSGSYYGNIMLTFSLSIILIYCIREIRKGILKRAWTSFAAFTAVFIVLLYGVYMFCKLKGVDYGFAGVITPVLCSVFMSSREEKKKDCKWAQIIMLTVGTVFIILQKDSAEYQWFSLFAIPLIALYNGKVGEKRLKYAFYLFYPLHLAVIAIISMIMYG